MIRPGLIGRHLYDNDIPVIRETITDGDGGIYTDGWVPAAPTREDIVTECRDRRREIRKHAVEQAKDVRSIVELVWYYKANKQIKNEVWSSMVKFNDGYISLCPRVESGVLLTPEMKAEIAEAFGSPGVHGYQFSVNYQDEFMMVFQEVKA